MSIKSWFADIFTPKALGTSQVGIVGTGSLYPQYPPSDYTDMAAGGYGKNEVVYACIAAIVSSFAEAPLRVYSDKDDSEIPLHPLRQLIQNPSPFHSEYELWEMGLIYLLLDGDLFFEKVRSASNKVVQLLPMRPDRTHIVPSKEEFIAGYQYEINGVKYPLRREDVIHIKYGHPLNDYFGQSPLQAALRQVATDNEATDFTKVTLQNRGIAPGLIIKTQEKLDEARLERLRSQFLARYNADNRGKPMFLQKDMDVQTVSLNLHELMFPDLRDISEARICAAYRVPPIVIGLNVGLKRATFANYEEARKAFYQDTIQPLQNRVDDSINRGLVSDFGGGVTCRFDISRVTALADIRQKKWNNAKEGVVGGWMTVNEARVEVGLPQVQNGDEFLRGLAITGTEATPIVTARAKGVSLIKATPGESGAGLLRSAIGRRARAEAYIPKIKTWAVKEFQLEAKEVMKVIRKYAPKGITTKDLLQQELFDLKELWTKRIGEDGAEILMIILIDIGIAEAALIGVTFELGNEAVQAFIKDYGFKFAEGISHTSIQDVQAIILRAQTEGLSYTEMVDAFTDQFKNWTSKRALMVARTETIRAGNRGAEEIWRMAGVKEKEWQIASDACDYCVAMQGKTADIGANFYEQGDSLTPLPKDPEDPEDPPIKPMVFNYEAIQAPPLHPNCLVGETPIFAPDQFAAFIATYNGIVVDIGIADGRRLTVSPNHMFLTLNGFIAAKHLHKGDQILDSATSKRIVGGNPNNNGYPTVIKDVINAFTETPGVSTRRVPMSAEYLHGDARFVNGDIDIVAPDGFLMGKVNPTPLESITEANFNRADIDRIGFNGCRDFTSMLFTLSNAADSIMGSRSESRAFSGRESLHPDDISLASGSGSDSLFSKDSANNSAINTESLRECQFRFASEITLADVVDVSVRKFNGHVYDLQTLSTIYTANGLLSSNCRCVLLPVV